MSMTETAEVPTLDVHGWETYYNAKYDFSLKYPRGWSVTEADDDELRIINKENILTVSILDFRSSTATFDDWVNERPFALIPFRDREALRWSRRGPVSPAPEARLFSGIDHFLIPTNAKNEVVIDLMLSMPDTRACENCVEIFEQIARSLMVGGVR